MACDYNITLKSIIQEALNSEPFHMRSAFSFHPVPILKLGASWFLSYTLCMLVFVFNVKHEPTRTATVTDTLNIDPIHIYLGCLALAIKHGAWNVCTCCLTSKSLKKRQHANV